MDALSDPALLRVWDRGRRRNGVTRALLLAGAASDAAASPPAETLTVGERDHAILRLRAATFGARFEGVADCPRCGERLEFDFDAGALADAARSPVEREFRAAGFRFRLPDSRDLHAISVSADEASAVQALLARCCLDDVDGVDWAPPLVAQVETAIAALDATADIRLGLHCAACGHDWQRRLDVAAWCWDEIDLRAQRLLDEVHCLAGAYGWNEAEILALGDNRRRAYLDRCVA